MKNYWWVLLVIIFVIIDAGSLTFINNNNIESQIFQLNKFESCKLLSLELILTNSSDGLETTRNCSSSALLDARTENEKYLKNKKFIIIPISLSILSSVALIILSIMYPFNRKRK